ncbi:MAG: glutamate--tRNA ligase, partial [Solirubrobacteraceae bacterium]
FKQTLIKNQSIEQEDKIAEIIPLVKERIENLNTIWEQISYFFKTPIDFEEKAFSKVQKFDTASILKGLVDKIQTTESFLKQNIEDEIKNWIKDTGLENGKVMQTLRLALVGSLKGPDLFHIIEIIGKQESVKRINNLNSKFN